MQKIRQILTALGVEEDAIELYTLLFGKGALPITEIARATAMHRPRVYALLGELCGRGLVDVHMRGKRHTYAAASPEKIKDMIAQLYDETERALPDLEREYKRGGDKAAIVTYEGASGVTAVFRDLVESAARGETFYRYTSEKDLDRTNKYLPRDYRKIRDAKKLERFVITAPRIGKGKKARMERAMKFIPPGFDLFDQDVIELLYADKVAFIDLNTETSFVIESKPLADFHKKLFRLLYQKL